MDAVAEKVVKGPRTRLLEELDEFDRALNGLSIAGNETAGHERISDIGQALTHVGCVLRNIGMWADKIGIGDEEVLLTAAMRLSEAKLPVGYKNILLRSVEHEARLLSVMYSS